MRHVMRQVLSVLAEICFPSRCLFCRRDTSPGDPLRLCDPCLSELSFLTGEGCPRCGMPFTVPSVDHFCGPCLKGENIFDQARSLLAYRGPLRDVVHSFKYHRNLTCIGTFGALFRESLTDSSFFLADLIVPVPLHTSRLRQRGFNQSLLLAREFFRERKEKIKPRLLERHRPKPPQTSLNGRQRRLNVRGAFRVTNPSQVRDRTLVLVDDIYTTGATLNECARVLKRAGARRVTALTLARVVD